MSKKSDKKPKATKNSNKVNVSMSEYVFDRSNFIKLSFPVKRDPFSGNLIKIDKKSKS